MAIDLDKFEGEARNAIKAFWGTKDAATQAQIARGARDVGARAAVTAGNHLNAFVALLADVARSQGLNGISFYTGRAPTLPGFFRPTKNWDLVLMRGEQLVAAFELKSIGSSFGKNMNNRSEEAVGSAQDFWTAFRDGAFGLDRPRPFLGWVMIMNDCDESSAARRASERFFPVFSEFHGASYAMRCDIMCKRLVLENLYTATALMLTNEEQGAATGQYSHLSENSSFRRFLALFAGHVAAIAADAKT